MKTKPFLTAVEKRGPIYAVVIEKSIFESCSADTAYRSKVFQSYTLNSQHPYSNTFSENSFHMGFKASLNGF